jgi:hypothetical protein
MAMTRFTYFFAFTRYWFTRVAAGAEFVGDAKK